MENDKKMAFIICYNNELYFQECLGYLRELKIPEGYDMDVIAISEADSMTAGYNAAMHSVDAKYKVYLHQDVFILNENFIQDAINLFQKNPEYGILGVLGTADRIEDANYWKCWNLGMTYANDGQRTMLYKGEYREDDIILGEAVDGMIIITQYDVLWREEIFDGFDFYDISQCMEFQKQGHKVGIINQKEPWCLHDCGCSKMSCYEHYRKVFCDSYAEMGYHFQKCEEQEKQIENEKMMTESLVQIEKLLESGLILEAREMINEIKMVFDKNTRLRVLERICMIALVEKEKNVLYGFYESQKSLSEMLVKYSVFRFWLMRTEFGKSVDRYEEIAQLIGSYSNPYVCLVILIMATCVNPQEEMRKLLGAKD